MENENFINKLISKWEDDTTEFKLSIEKDKVGRTICAFANDFNNLDVGYLVIGVNEKTRCIKGVEIDNWDETQKLLANICNSIIPPVIPQLTKIETRSGEIALLIKVNRSMMRPHRYRGKCYVRVFSTTRTAEFGEENLLKTKSTASFLTFDALANMHATYDDLDEKKIVEHYRMTRENEFLYRDDLPNIKKVLKRGLELSRDVEGKSYPTNSAILMFGKDPQKFFSNAYINAIRFEGDNRGGRIFERMDIKGTLDSMLSRSLSYLKQFMATESKIEPDTLLRIDLKEYPDIALREAIANAIIHRDYQDINGPPIDLYMFDDRIEISNFGGLPGGLKLKDLGTGKRYLRNPTLATFMYEKKWIEKAGTGIIRIYHEMNRNESPEPKFEADDKFLKVILPSNSLYKAYRYIEDSRKAAFRGDIEKAKGLLTEATNCCPDSIEVWLAFGQIYMQNDEFNEAKQCFEKARNLPTDSAMPLLRLADLEIREKSKYYEKRVRSLFKEASKLEPNNPILFHKWGVFENNQQNLNRASELFKKSTVLDPNNSACWQAWGQSEIRRGEAQYGISLLEKAKAVAEKSSSNVLSWIYCDIAWGYQVLNSPVEVIIKYYELAKEANSNDQHSLRKYAAFLEKIGRKEASYMIRKSLGKRKVWKRNTKDLKISHYTKKSINDLNEGEIVEGKIVAIVNFGAFVDIGANENALIHISEISDDYIGDVHDYLTKGEKKRFKIVYLNSSENKIQLSLKQLDI